LTGNESVNKVLSVIFGEKLAITAFTHFRTVISQWEKMKTFYNIRFWSKRPTRKVECKCSAAHWCKLLRSMFQMFLWDNKLEAINRLFALNLNKDLAVRNIISSFFHVFGLYTLSTCWVYWNERKYGNRETPRSARKVLVAIHTGNTEE